MQQYHIDLESFRIEAKNEEEAYSKAIFALAKQEVQIRIEGVEEVV